MRNLLVAVGAGLAATAVAASTAAGSTALAVVLAAAQVLLACAWASALGATTGTTILVIAAAVASDVTLLVSDDAAVGDLVGVAGLAIVATILYQLARRRIRTDSDSDSDADADSPRTAPLRVTSDMAASLGGVSVVVFFATLLALGEQGGSPDADAGYPLIVTGLLGAGAAVFVPRCLDAVVGDDPSRSRRTASWATVAGVAAAAGAGAACGAVATSLTAAEGAAVAVVSGAAAAVVDAALARSGTSRTPSATGVAALLPLAVAAPTVYLVGQLFLP